MTRKGLITALPSVAFVALAIGALNLVVLRPARARARRLACYSNLAQIIIASREYARENGTGYQTNLICLSNELNSPMLLWCVNDDVRYRQVRDKLKPLEGYGSAEHWARLTMNDCSYEAFFRDTNTLVVRCPIHKMSVYANPGMTNPAWRHEGL